MDLFILTCICIGGALFLGAYIVHRISEEWSRWP